MEPHNQLNYNYEYLFVIYIYNLKTINHNKKKNGNLYFRIQREKILKIQLS